MPRIVQRERARRDLIAQFVWYGEQGNIDLARRFRRAATETFRLIANQPLCGVLVRDLVDVRRFPLGGGFGRLLVYYRPTTMGIEVIRVLDASRDVHSMMPADFDD